MPEHADDADSGAQCKKGRDDREDRGEERAEDEEEDDEGQDHPRRCPAEGLFVRQLGQLTRHRYLEMGPAADVAVLTNLSFGLGEVIGLSVERHRDEGHGPVGVDLGAPAGSYGLVTRPTCGSFSILAIIALILAISRVGHLRPARRGKHDLLGVARDLGRRRLQQLDRVRRLGVGKGERIRVRGPDAFESPSDMRTRAQMRSTSRRWLTHHPARVRISEFLLGMGRAAGVPARNKNAIRPGWSRRPPGQDGTSRWLPC